MTLPISRNAVVVIAIALLLAGADFFTRVYVGRDAALREFNAPPPAAPLPLPDPAAISSQLAQWLPVLSDGPKVQADPNSPDSWDLALKGVFKERARSFVVIIARPKGGGGVPVVHRVGVGETLLGLSVAEIRRDSVVLQGPGGPHELSLYPRKPGTP
jgi:hypothetical protein